MWYRASEERKTNEEILGSVTSAALSEDLIYTFNIFIFWLFSGMLTFNFNIRFTLKVYSGGFETLLNVMLSSQICEKENVVYYGRV